MTFKTYFHKEEITYTGLELRPHFILSQFKVEGSCLAAFLGPAEVETENMVDWEDRMQFDKISAKKMLHFVGEFFFVTLREGVWIQRLIVSQLHSILLTQGIKVQRRGDDLYIRPTGTQEKKLNVSIVTASAVSVLLHIGINVDSTGAPVSAIGLNDLGIEPIALTESLLKWFQEEYTGVERACVKVRPVT